MGNVPYHERYILLCRGVVIDFEWYQNINNSYQQDPLGFFQRSCLDEACQDKRDTDRIFPSHPQLRTSEQLLRAGKVTLNIAVKQKHSILGLSLIVN